MKSQTSGSPLGDSETAWSRMKILQAPWLWSFVGALLVWFGIVGVFGFGIAANVAQTALTYGVFMVLVGLGQMLVITSGVGNIDLSVPSTIALAGVIGMHVMGGANGRVALGTFATGRLFDVPYIALLALALSAALAVLLHRAVYGRKLSAIGQNARAAWLAGVDVHRTRCLAYVLCSMIAALTALLLAATSGGASLDMGVEYMLISIAVVVIGGTLVTGGKATIVGVWGASMFLFLTNAALNAIGADAGVRAIVYGVLIIVVTVAAGGKTAR